MKLSDYLKNEQLQHEKSKYEKQVATIRQNRLTAKPKGQTRQEVIDYIDLHPGATVRQIERAMGRKISRIPNYVKGGYLVSRKLDGKARYFPKNYRVPGAVMPVPTDTVITHVSAPPQARIRFGNHHRTKGQGLCLV